MSDEIPDYPPLPQPGDLVLAAFNRYPLTEDDWQRFIDGTERWRREQAAAIAAMKRGVRVAPLYRLPIAEQVQHEADRLEELGEPEWRLWAAFAEERRLRDG